MFEISLTRSKNEPISNMFLRLSMI